MGQLRDRIEKLELFEEVASDAIQDLRDEIDSLKIMICKLNNQRKIDKKDNLTFGEALEFVKKGLSISRKCWNNKKIFIFKFKSILDEPMLVVRTVKNLNVTWMPNHSELLCDDWYVIDEN